MRRLSNICTNAHFSIEETNITLAYGMNHTSVRENTNGAGFFGRCVIRVGSGGFESDWSIILVTNCSIQTRNPLTKN